MNIIVARYNENIEWTKELNNVIIYNKGDNLDNSYNEIHLKNIGKVYESNYTHGGHGG